MNIYWSIQTLWVRPVEGSLTDVVVTAAWRCNGTDGTYNGSVYATVSFSPPNPDDFTPYLNLTQEQVLQWVWTSGVDKDSAEAAVVQQIENQKNPPIITPPLPWPPGPVPADSLTAPIIAPPLPDMSVPPLATPAQP